MSVETRQAPAPPGARSAAGPAGGRRGSPELWAVVALTALGAALRFSTLDVQSFWHDEAVTVGRVLDPSLFQTLGHVPGSEATPPLYYALAWAWTKLFGSGEVGIRSLSALCGTASIPVVWWAGRALISRSAGVGAAALCAVAPYMVWYSQEARAYALLVLLCALSLALFGEALRDRAGGRWLAWWALASALALLTHYFAVFVVGPELALLVWLLPERRRAALLAGAAVAVVGAALIPLAVHQAHQGHDGWIARIALGTRVKDTGRQFVLGYSGSPARALSLVTVAILAACAVLAVWRRPGRWWLVVAVAAAALAVPLVAKAAGADYLYHRNLIAAWIPLAVALGAAAAWPRIGPLAIGALCACFLVLTIAVDVDTKLQRADWRGAARALGPAPPGGRLVVVPAIGDDPMAYYAHAAKLAHGTRAVREIDVVGFAAAPRSRARRVPPGFVAAGRARSAGFKIDRYRAARRSAVARPAAARARLGTGHAAVLVQSP